MGEANRRQKHRDMRASGQACIYCGEPAVGIEHCPARILFVDKDRPAGWEFPACSSCNSGISQLDQIFAFYVFASIQNPSDAQFKHFQKVRQGVGNNVPDVVMETRDGVIAPIHDPFELWRQEPQLYTAKLGPLVKASLEPMFDKLTVSAYYRTKGVRPPPTSGVWYRHFTNADILAGKLKDVPRWFGPLRPIEMGTKTTKYQFEFQEAFGEDGVAAFVFVFQRSIFVLSMLIPDREIAPKRSDESPAFRALALTIPSALRRSTRT